MFADNIVIYIDSGEQVDESLVRKRRDRVRWKQMTPKGRSKKKRHCPFDVIKQNKGLKERLNSTF